MFGTTPAPTITTAAVAPPPLPNHTAVLLLVATCVCPPGEYAVRECTPTTAAVCWPCEAGFACSDGEKRRCAPGREWSGTGMDRCAPCASACETGMMLVRPCDDGTSDRVCAECPPGFECGADGSTMMRACRPGTYSKDGVCVPCGENRTTRDAGARSESECVCLFRDVEEEEEQEKAGSSGGGRRCLGSCRPGQVAVGGGCRSCPPGYGCRSATEEGEDGEEEEQGRGGMAAAAPQQLLHMCKEGTYSSPLGTCVPCVPNSHSPAGAASEDECICEEGYVKRRADTGRRRRSSRAEGGRRGRATAVLLAEEERRERRCVPCEPGTVFTRRRQGRWDQGTAVAGGDGSVANGGEAAGEAQQGATAGEEEEEGRCEPCPAGSYCLGRMHQDLCPLDMYSPGGAAICSQCRMNSGCLRDCVDQANCTCDDGYVDHGGECRRCPAATMRAPRRRAGSDHADNYYDGPPTEEEAMAKETDHAESPPPLSSDKEAEYAGSPSPALSSSSSEPPSRLRTEKHTAATTTCIPCPSGMECRGGAEVRACALATFSGGNRSRCARCTRCQEITVARCNATHDSVCEATPYALAVITLVQRYRTMASGEVFAMFALVFASSIPKAQLVRVCRDSAAVATLAAAGIGKEDDLETDEEGGWGGGSAEDGRCVRCFQGKCPVERMKRLMPGPEHAYMLEIEIRPNALRLTSNVESLTQSAFLPELAKTTMAKLTDLPFTLHTHVEHSVICPNEGAWNGGECVPQYNAAASARAWIGLGASIVIIALIGAYGSRARLQRRREEEVAASRQRWALVEDVTE